MPGKETSEHLTQGELSFVKRLIWEGGNTQKEIAVKFAQEFKKSVDQSSISRVKMGKLGRAVPWPDGFTGAFDPTRKTVTWSSEAEEYTKWPDDIQDKILWVVNKRRRKEGLEEFPPIDMVYQNWITASALDPIEETELMLIGKAREDNRRKNIMEEFLIITQEHMDIIRQRTFTYLLEEEVNGESKGVLSPAPDIRLKKYEAATWEEVMYSWNRIQIVKRALLDQDSILAEAICILKHAVPNLDTEDKEYITKSVLSIRDRLQAASEFHSSIKEKHFG